MDNPTPESEKLLAIAANLLCDADFASSRKFALVARDYDGSNPVPDRLLAVADVMIADNTRNPNDWHPILQLTRPNSGNHTLVRTQFEKLAALLDPELNCFPFSDEALRLVNMAWGKLSGPTRVGNGSGEGASCEAGLAGETFWTVCPYCYGMFMYEKVYEERCLRCQVCRKAFHGVAIRPPAPEIMVEGKEEYYFAYGCFAMEYSEEYLKKSSEGFKEKKKEVEGVSVVEISDDDEEEVVVVKNVGEGKATGKRMKAPARRIKTKRGARKNVMGNGKGREGELGGECGDGDGERLEYFGR